MVECSKAHNGLELKSRCVARLTEVLGGVWCINKQNISEPDQPMVQDNNLEHAVTRS